MEQEAVFYANLANYTDELKGDTLIGDYSFKKLYRYFGKELDVSSTHPYAYMREADKRVYAVLNSQNNIGDYNLYQTGGLVIPSENYDAIGEYIIYDFNDIVGLSHVIENGEIIYKGCRYDILKETVGVKQITIDPEKPANDIYYNLLGEPVSTTKPTTPGIYIKGCRKVIVR